MTTRTPSRNWTKVPVFCSGEKHEIWWDETGRLRLPHHHSIDTAAVEAKLMTSGQLPDEFCFVFAGAVRGSVLCREVLQRAASVLGPELNAYVSQVALKRQSREHTKNQKLVEKLAPGITEYRHPAVLDRCHHLLQCTSLGIDTQEDEKARGYRSRRIIHVSSCSGKPSFAVQAARTRDPESREDGRMLILWVAVNPKSWASLYLKKKVVLEDPNTCHPSKCAFALGPGPDAVSLYCIRYKRAGYQTDPHPHTLELGLERVHRTEKGWAICDRKVWL